MDDLVQVSVFARIDRISEELERALAAEFFETGVDKEGRHFITRDESDPSTWNYHYLDNIAREMERRLFP